MHEGSQGTRPGPGPGTFGLLNRPLPGPGGRGGAQHHPPLATALRGPAAPWALGVAARSAFKVAAAAPCATLTRSMLTYYRTLTMASRSLHFPFGAVCSLSGSQPEIWPVSWKRPVRRIACRLFVVPLNPTFRRSSHWQAEGERAPGSSGPVHSGQYGPRPRGGTAPCLQLPPGPPAPRRRAGADPPAPPEP